MIFTIYKKLNNIAKENGWTIIIGSWIGIAVAFTFFYMRPVVVMQGMLIDRKNDTAQLHVWGKKIRQCKFLDIAGYTVKNGVMKDTRTVRVDLAEDASTKPLGTFDLGQWLIFPIGDADAVEMHVTHSCGPGDIRVTKIADVSLK